MTPAVGQRGLLAQDWRAIRHFSVEEVAAACEQGAWWNIDAGSLYQLDVFAGYAVDAERLVAAVTFMPTRTAAGIPTATWNRPETKAHSPGSLHERGRAFDLLFPRSTLATAWFTAVRFPKWGGVGAYPFWRPDPGLHLDTRWAGDAEQGAGFRVMWWVDSAGMYHYLNAEDDIREFLGALKVAA